MELTTIAPCDPTLNETCTGIVAESFEDVDWLEQRILGGFRRWHVIFLTAAGIQAIITFFCCCFRIRIPRTKMEIEADYRRKALAKKFRQKLKIIQNIEMDEMDLKKALDRIRAEFRSDTESLAHSEAALSLPDDGAFADGISLTPTYQRGSQVTLGFSLEDLQQEAQMTPLRRMSNTVTGFFRGIPGWFRRNYNHED